MLFKHSTLQPKKYGNQKPESFAFEYNVLTYLPLALFCSLAAGFETFSDGHCCAPSSSVPTLHKHLLNTTPLKVTWLQIYCTRVK